MGKVQLSPVCLDQLLAPVVGLFAFIYSVGFHPSKCFDAVQFVSVRDLRF